MADHRTLKPSWHSIALILALAAAFVVGSGPGRSHFWNLDYGTVSVAHLTVAANRSPEHGFLGFHLQYLSSAGERAYQPYNRFPIGGYLLIKAVMLPFPDDIGAQVQAARMLALAFFAVALVVAYRSLKRLTASASVALAATLCAFSSFWMLHYADMVATEGSMDLFAVLLTFHALVVFAQEGRFAQLLAKTCAALLIGWHALALLLPFILLGLVAECWRTPGGIGRRAARLLRSRHVVLGAVALSFGLSVLALNFGLEAAALAGEPWAREGAETPLSAPPSFGDLRQPPDASADDAKLVELPSFASMLKRLGWNAEFNARHADAVAWVPLLRVLLERAGRACVPYFAEHVARGLFDQRAGGVQARRGAWNSSPSAPPSEGSAKPTDAGGGWLAGAVLLLGALACAAAAVLVAVARHRVLTAALLASGFCWGLMARGSVPYNPFEGMFLVGLPLFLFSFVLMQAQRFSKRVVDGCAVGALLIFSLSCWRIGELGPDVDAASDFRTLLADMQAVRDLVAEGEAVIAYGDSGEARYMLSGRMLLSPLNGRQRQRADFVLSRRRIPDAGLLTPDNRHVFLYRRSAYDRRYATLADPAVEGGRGWNVHLVDRRWIFASGEPCAARQGFAQAPPFFVEAFPARQRRKAVYFGGVAKASRIEFRFADAGFEVAGRCIAEVVPPPYEVARIRIGQFGPGGAASNGKRPFAQADLWSEELRLEQGASALEGKREGGAQGDAANAPLATP